jgi:glycosyltransferase involved in cell wall biosynthesis
VRIAQIAPLYESVPPPLYGGTERVVATLTDELVKRGHEVTLFATADSTTAAMLVPCCDAPLRPNGRLEEAYAQTAIQLDLVYSRAGAFDIIHNHVDFPAFPLARASTTPTVTTLHGRLDLPEVERVLAHFAGLPLVAISHAQRAQAPSASWAGVVHHGIRLDHFTFRPDPGSYLAFVGRISLDKRVDRAIEIARTVNMPLKVAAKVGVEDGSAYYEAIKPMLEHPLVEFLGEVDEAEKDALLGGASALLFPIDWPEPFGLTMVEAMATGTPVIAYDAGSVREVVDHGRTGFVCRSVVEMVEAVPLVPSISREACRRRVEALFTPERMAEGYEQIYQAVLGRASVAA